MVCVIVGAQQRAVLAGTKNLLSIKKLYALLLFLFAAASVQAQNINLPTPAGSTVKALDIQGRVMATLVLGASTMPDIANWPAGIYMLKFSDGSVLKVVKQ